MENQKQQGKSSGKRVQRSTWRWVWAIGLLLAALLNLLIAGLNTRHPSVVTRYLWHRPGGIILHHSATAQRVDGRLVDAAFIDRMHARRGFNGFAAGRNYHIGYHYVILGDGTVQSGRPEWMWGAHTKRHNDQLGICLIGDFSSGDNPNGRNGPLRPTQAQLDALNRLLRQLTAKYDFRPEDLHRHRDYAPTACPGDRFPFEQVVRKAFASPRVAGTLRVPEIISSTGSGTRSVPTTR